MVISVNQAFNGLPAVGTPNYLQDQVITYFQDAAFFQLAFAKQQRIDHLKRYFLEHAQQGKTRLLIGNALRGHAIDSPHLEISYLSKDFFLGGDEASFSRKCNLLSGAIMLVTNNDIHIAGMPHYIQLYENCPDTIFIVWDWDNHHWLSLSAVLAAHSDLYVPAHQDNRYLLSRFNVEITEAVAGGSDQWTTPFLKDHFREITTYPRIDEPLGMHRRYDPFSYRNQVITTLNKRYPSIGFSPLHYEQKSPEVRLAEWCGHKVHWVVPVLNDVPIRLFDALITGGIPLVPESLRFLQILHDIPTSDILYYGAVEIVEPVALVNKAIQLFNEGGAAGIRRRFRYALEKHHVDVRIRDMIHYASVLFEVDF